MRLIGQLILCICAYLSYYFALTLAERHTSLARRTSNFRIGKLNKLYEKASKILTDEDLISLYGDFAVQDELEFKWKQEKPKAEEANKYDVSVRKSLLNILSKHGLSRLYDDGLINDSNRNYKKLDNSYYEIGKENEKLADLWHQARNLNLTSDEFSALKDEFDLHLIKLKQYKDIKNKLETIDASQDNIIVKEDNKNKGINLQLEDLGKTLEESYNKIAFKISQKLDPSQFSDYRIAQLWDLARRVNLPEEELQSLKEELNSFGRRIQKYEQLYREVEIAKFQKHQSQDYADLINELQTKVKSQAAKVKKWHHELKTRLANRIQHTDL